MPESDVSFEFRQKLLEAAELARRSIAPGLEGPPQAGDQPDFAGSCLHTSVVLQQLLERFFAASAVVRGGAGGDSLSGAIDRQGRWHGHFWVEATSNNSQTAKESGDDAWVVDATGDQFGHAPVRVMRLNDSLGYLRAVDQATVDAQVQDLLSSIANHTPAFKEQP